MEFEEILQGRTRLPCASWQAAGNGKTIWPLLAEKYAGSGYWCRLLEGVAFLPAGLRQKERMNSQGLTRRLDMAYYLPASSSGNDYCELYAGYG